MKVPRKSKWIYVGESKDYNGLICTVGYMSGNRLHAWSDVNQGSIDDPGLTWFGPRDLFLLEFKPK